MEPGDTRRHAELLREGRDAFDRGEFYEAHELWEEVWDVVDPPERTWLQGLIQVATGLHKLQRGRPDVCRTLLEKGLAKLTDAPPRLDPPEAGTDPGTEPGNGGAVDVASVRDGARAILDRIAASQAADPRSVRATPIPPGPGVTSDDDPGAGRPA